ncbi:hypothetical protein ABB37_07455 [Leptomonas pyrrhocoris]|uniref:Uncharacterized protein n=1 Tax=Leptomonas pyrrhocoris TaxID=157538 RepID=A0A0M9FUX0_LEPPY|nr:hypothetical protein ABB37_07455 [Leptomonas pyrrhocoris]KPA76585.1 hypothetical protein ABB37_07455 [Leptomonas pyrrhocoris]|eukprot:XP_015655024.1 hypothetical protein ABB37_07455 [Leptomonas pyrrhocoris]
MEMYRPASPSAGAPAWLRDINQQLIIRNAVELKPSQRIFESYTLLRTSALQMQAVEEERQRLQVERNQLADRVRELERAAANTSVQTSRERALEAKKDELQDQLQLYMLRESEYYKGLTEMKELKSEKEELQRSSTATAAELEQRTAELQLLHKEYTSLRDEYECIRLSVGEADRSVREAKQAKGKVTQMQERITVLEAEVSDLRRRLQDALAGEKTEMSEDARATGVADEAELTRDTAQRATDSYVDAQVLNSPMQRTSEPTRASMVIVEAHNGSLLHGLCVLDDGNRFLTSGTDKYIRLWNRQSAQAEKYFSSSSIALSLDTSSHYLLAGCADHIVRFWDTNSLRMLEMTGHTEKVVAACLSSSAQHAFTASSDGTIKLWDIRRREALRTLLCQSTCNDVTVAGDTIFSAHYNGKITVWDRRTAARSGEVTAHQRVATCVRVSASGQLCVSLGKDNAISVRDARLFSKTLHTFAPEQLTVPMNWARLSLSPSGQVCAVGQGRTSDLLLVRLDSALEASPQVKLLKASVPSTGANEAGTGTSKGPIFSTAWGANEGGPLVSISDDRCVEVWE